MLAKEMPFAKDPCNIEQEKRHGVQLGTAYSMDRKCKELTCVISDVMKDQLIESIRRIPYPAVLMDGSTDSSVTENEAINVLVVGADGTPECHFFAIKSVPEATAFGIKALLEKEFPDIGGDLADKVISVCVEGAV